MQTLRCRLHAALSREDGQTMAEYGTVLAVVTIAALGALTLLSGNVSNALTRVAGFLS
jgi:Flp pilus assembly pilin Flp